MSAATRQRKSNLYVDKREGSASLLSQRREVNLLYTVAKNSMFMLERQCYAFNPYEQPPLLSNHLTKIPIVSSVSQIAISETSRKRPPMPDIKGGCLWEVLLYA